MDMCIEMREANKWGCERNGGEEMGFTRGEENESGNWVEVRNRRGERIVKEVE